MKSTVYAFVFLALAAVIAVVANYGSKKEQFAVYLPRDDLSGMQVWDKEAVLTRVLPGGKLHAGVPAPK